jgi:hypothetical protein
MVAGGRRYEDLDGGGPAYYQTRFWARVELDDFQPQDDTIGRRLVAPRDFRTALWWGATPTAGLIFDRALAIEAGLGP